MMQNNGRKWIRYSIVICRDMDKERYCIRTCRDIIENSIVICRDMGRHSIIICRYMGQYVSYAGYHCRNMVKTHYYSICRVISRAQYYHMQGYGQGTFLSYAGIWVRHGIIICRDIDRGMEEQY
jgi:hypothetical protein